ncbi:MAG: hypothetical protein ACPHQD_12150 [Vibrio toranzoniae]|jgi:hypothetical protein|nr:MULTISPECIES: hypothetical protein [Vibrio]MDA0142664.1 hypothetical protein [Vibrio sp. RW]SBS31015.1 hypothetical protein VTO7225_01336 [Vibrio toranzoniae]
MNYELGNVYLGQIAAKNMMHEALYGKPKSKKPSFFKRMRKKMAK